MPDCTTLQPDPGARSSVPPLLRRVPTLALRRLWPPASNGNDIPPGVDRCEQARCLESRTWPGCDTPAWLGLARISSDRPAGEVRRVAARSMRPFVCLDDGIEMVGDRHSRVGSQGDGLRPRAQPRPPRRRPPRPRPPAWAYLTTLPVHLDGPLSAYLLVGTLLCICPVSPK
jgi:hypothetical protein